MRKTAWMALPLAALIGLAACSSPPPPPPAAPPPPPPAPEAPPPPPAPPTASSDQDFINQAAGINATEIGTGRLATGKATAKDIRAYASRMIADHTRAQHELEALAKRLKIEVSPPPDQPPPDLLTASGPDFDKQYIQMMIKGHQDAISLFESEANNGQDPRAKRFARNMLPQLRHHLSLAQAIGKKLGM